MIPIKEMTTVEIRREIENVIRKLEPFDDGLGSYLCSRGNTGECDSLIKRKVELEGEYFRRTFVF